MENQISQMYFSRKSFKKLNTIKKVNENISDELKR
jgi:hypothetical protein